MIPGARIAPMDSGLISVDPGIKIDIKQTNKYITGVPQGTQREMANSLFKEMIIGNFPVLEGTGYPTL
jgi:hypothetical protein